MNKQEQKSKIQGFIKSVTEKNYAEANKYLKGILDHKLGQKIQHNKDKPFFK